MADKDDIQVFYGSEVKALGDGKVGGYLVKFGSEKEHDGSRKRDWFSPDTDYDFEKKGDKTTVYYAHGLDGTIKNKKLGKDKGTIEIKDEVGVWVETQLDLRDAYERAIYGMVEKDKLGWSSGVPAHLVRREQTGDSNKVLYWPLGKDASLTPNPAEHRTMAVALKSLDLKEVEWEKVLEELEKKDTLGIISPKVKQNLAVGGIVNLGEGALTSTGTADTATISIAVKMKDLDVKTLTLLLLQEVKALKTFVEEDISKRKKEEEEIEEILNSREHPLPKDKDKKKDEQEEQSNPDQQEQPDDLLNALYVEPVVEPEPDIIDDLNI